MKMHQQARERRGEKAGLEVTAPETNQDERAEAERRASKESAFCMTRKVTCDHEGYFL